MPFRAESRDRRRENQQLTRVRTAAKGMKKLQRQLVMTGLCVAIALPAAGQVQAPVPAAVQTQTTTPAPQAPPPAQRPRTIPDGPVSLEGSEAVFATIFTFLRVGLHSNSDP